MQAAYGVNYEQLVALKNTYDPTNFFSLNQNMRPTGGMTGAICMIDRNDHTTSNEYVADQRREPDDAAALQAIQQASSSPR